MSAASQARIFGMKVGVDPKFLVLGLVAVAGLLFWFNSRADDTRPTGQTAIRGSESANVAGPTANTGRNVKDRRVRGDRGSLKLKTVAPGTGEVDPLLRLDLLEKLARVEPAPQTRNLFEVGPAAAQQAAALPVRTITPKPVLPPQPVVTPAMQLTPQINIPLKYYGFARPSFPGDANRGFFMDGDDIMVAAEGQTLRGQYRVVQLTPGNAVVEDTQAKLSQTLNVTPEALDQGANAYNRQNGMMQNGAMQNGPMQNGFQNNGGDNNEP
jgi:hypothetical protein